MVIQHRPGKKHGNADGLSRIPDDTEFCNCYEAGVSPSSLPCGGCAFCTKVHSQWSRFESDVDDIIPLSIRSASLAEPLNPSDILSPEFLGQEETDTNWLPQYSAEELRKAQLNDPDLAKILNWLESKETPPINELYLCSPTIKRFWLTRSQLKVQDGVLYYKWEGHPARFLLLVPTSLKEEVLQGCHDCPTSGHLGQKKTLARVKRSFIWHDMQSDILEYVRTCCRCNRNKKPRVKPRASLGCFHAGARMERVHMDMLGPFPQSEWGNKYILVMVDQFSKWVEIHAIPDISAAQTARCAIDQFFSRFGAPLQIHTDQGKNFDGNIMKALCDLYRITKTRTTPYRPCSNGQVERYNRLLLQIVRCYLRAKDKTWDQDLQLLAGAIRGMEHRATGFSANMMMLGMEVFTPIDILMRTAGEHYRDENPAGYVQHLRKVLREVHDLATKKLRSQLKYQQRAYDLKLQETHYEVGDFVYRLNGASKTGESKKLKPVWVGPFVVIAVLNPVLFRVKDRKKEYVLHHDRLKRCEDRHIPLWLRKLRHGLLDLDTTIAYDEAEQEDLSPPSVPKFPVENDSQSSFTMDEVPEDTPISSTPIEMDPCSSTPESDPNTSLIDGKSQSNEEMSPNSDIPLTKLSTDNAPGNDTLDVDLPPTSSLSDSQVKDASDLLLVEDDLCLDTLFDDVIHIHAQKRPVTKKGKSRSPSSLPSASPAESTSKTGRQRKPPSYLREYTR